MGLLSAFMGKEGEHSIGDNGREDGVLVAIIDQGDGASVAEIQKSFTERGREITEAELNALLEKLLKEKRVTRKEKDGEINYFLATEKK